MSFKPLYAGTKQHRFDIPMPWKREVYAINWDEKRIGRPRLVFVWWREFGCFFLRVGWIYDFGGEYQRT
jgi:hypothetical protein